MKSNSYRYRFIPYIVNEILIGETKLSPFMVWVNINDYNKRRIEDAPILFGMDYFHQGRKWFDDGGNIHMEFDDNVTFDTGDVGAALKQSGAIMRIRRMTIPNCKNGLDLLAL